MRPPTASIVVLSYNGLEHLEVCLSSVCEQSYSDREIILLDNGSTDGTESWVKVRFPEVRVVRLEVNCGVPAGLNAGVSHAQGKFIAILNNDIELDHEWLAESIRALDKHPDAGFTATRIRLFYQRDRLDTAGDLFFRAGFPAKRGWLHRDGPEFDKPTWVFGACAAAAVYRREVFNEIGAFDEDFQAVLEDLDLSFRAQLRGFKCLYVPTAIIYHKLGATLGSGATNREHHLRMHRNIWLVRIKNLPAVLWLRYLPHMLIGELAVLFQSLRSGRFGVLARARLQVLQRLGSTMEKRRRIQSLRTVSAAELDAIISRNWIAHRLGEKRLEAEDIERAPHS